MRHLLNRELFDFTQNKCHSLLFFEFSKHGLEPGQGFHLFISGMLTHIGTVFSGITCELFPANMRSSSMGSSNPSGNPEQPRAQTRRVIQCREFFRHDDEYFLGCVFHIVTADSMMFEHPPNETHMAFEHLRKLESRTR